MAARGAALRESLRVGSPRLEVAGSATRVVAAVGGRDVWFESDDAELSPSSEALVAAFLIPALGRGRRLELESPLASDFASHLPDVLDLAGRWWRYPRLTPTWPASPGASAPPPGAGTMLAFTCGVDSFFTLLASRRPVSTLLFVQGFDVAMADDRRAREVRAQVATVAAAAGVGMVSVRTNLREHPDFAAVSWERTHGGALAAVGHLLRNVSHRLLISSSYGTALRRPWGSHWELDPLWSGAGVTVEHVGEALMRQDKVGRIAHEHLAQRYLRVCWENRDPALNCTRCGKCVRTRIMLAAHGALAEFQTLGDPATLASDIDALPSADQRSHRHTYRWALQAGVPGDVAAALRRLLARSRRQELVQGVRRLVRRD